MLNLSVNHYAVLGVDRGAGPDQIKSAFREKAKRYHPDVCKEPQAEERFKEVNTAYQILSDPEKRKEYDALLDMASGKRIDMDSILSDLGVRHPASARPPRRRRQRPRRAGDPSVEDLPEGYLRSRNDDDPFSIGGGKDPFYDNSMGGII